MNKMLKRKAYDYVKIDLLYLDEQDLITASAGNFDSEKDNDLTSGDIFD